MRYPILVAPDVAIVIVIAAAAAAAADEGGSTRIFACNETCRRMTEVRGRRMPSRRVVLGW